MNENNLILKLYAIKDELNGFAPPIPFNNDEIAKRYFKEMCQENITIRISPKDFSIWKVGEYETTNGKLKSNVEPTLIERGETKA